jgi:hypothetical protein
MLSADEVRTLVGDIIELGNELRQYHGFEDEPAKAHPPPDKVALDSFAKHFKGKLPPSYLQLIAINNGIENFEWVDVSILSIEFLMKHEKLEKYWVDVGAYNKGDLFIFAKSDSDAHVVAFLTRTVDDKGEMEVAHFDAGGLLGQYKNLDEYLRDRREWYVKSVAMEKADRQGLAD